MARLSMDLRMQIIHKIYDELSEGKGEEQAGIRQALALDIRNHIISKYFKEFDTLPAEWFPKSNGFFINITNEERAADGMQINEELITTAYYGGYNRTNRNWVWKGCLIIPSYTVSSNSTNAICFPTPNDLRPFVANQASRHLVSGKFLAGQHVLLEYGEDLHVPNSILKHVLYSALSKELQERAVIAASNGYSQNSNIKKVLVNSFRVLNSCNTTKQLVTKWPEVERFIPADNETIVRRPRSTRGPVEPDIGESVDVGALTEDMQELL